MKEKTFAKLVAIIFLVTIGEGLLFPAILNSFIRAGALYLINYSIIFLLYSCFKGGK